MGPPECVWAIDLFFREEFCASMISLISLITSFLPEMWSRINGLHFLIKIKCSKWSNSKRVKRWADVHFGTPQTWFCDVFHEQLSYYHPSHIPSFLMWGWIIVFPPLWRPGPPIFTALTIGEGIDYGNALKGSTAFHLEMGQFITQRSPHDDLSSIQLNTHLEHSSSIEFNIVDLLEFVCCRNIKYKYCFNLEQ